MSDVQIPSVNMNPNIDSSPPLPDIIYLYSAESGFFLCHPVSWLLQTVTGINCWK